MHRHRAHVGHLRLQQLSFQVLRTIGPLSSCMQLKTRMCKGVGSGPPCSQLGYHCEPVIGATSRILLLCKDNSCSAYTYTVIKWKHEFFVLNASCECTKTHESSYRSWALQQPSSLFLLLQVYSVELVGVMSQACKRQLDIIHSALCPDEHQNNGLQSPAQQQRIPCLAEPYQLVRALFILLQNPLNGQLISSLRASACRTPACIRTACSCCGC